VPALLAVSLLALALHAAHAQQVDWLADLAKRRANPLSGLRQITVAEQANVDLTGEQGVQNVAQLLVNWPIALGPRWSLVTYTIVTGTSQPNDGDGRVGGLGDTMITAAVTPTESGTLIWGIGPVLQIPTATDPALGSNRWAAGPAVAAYVQPGRWTAGALVENAWSPRESGAQNVSAFSVLYNLTWNAPHGWFVESNATITADWTADSGDRWTVPVGGGFGRVFVVGSSSFTASVELFYNAVRPAGGAAWSPSVSLQVLLPD